MGANYDKANSDERAAIIGAADDGARGELTLEEYLTKNRPSPKVIAALVARFEASAEYRMMSEGYAYFKNATRIDGKKRTIIGEGGTPEDYPEGVLSNSKVKHPDFPTMVRQKKAYLMSRPFSIHCEDKGLQEVLEGYFNERVRATIKEGVARATYSGRCPFEVYYDSKGAIRVAVRRPTEVVPYWADDEHTELIAALRMSSSTMVSDDGTLREVRRYSFYNGGGVYRYVVGEGGSADYDPSASFGGVAGKSPNFYRDVVEVDASGKAVTSVDPSTGAEVRKVNREGFVFSRIPILFFKYNSEEDSLLTYVKPLIDEYDETSSQYADELKDTENSIKVIKGYNGENLGELVHNLKLFRAVSVQADGDVSSVTTPIAYQAYENHLTRLRKDMYSAGSCVDTTRVDNLGNQSGIAMRYIYSDLDMTSMEMWDSLEEQVLKPLVEFFLYDYAVRNPSSARKFSSVKVDFIPNTDIAVNETETISNIKNSVGIVSNETLLANHPYVTDVTAEMERVKKEREEAMAEMAADGIGGLGNDREPKEITSRRNGGKSQG